MNRLFWLGCLIASLTTTANAEEYLLRLEEVGYLDQPATDPPPQETTIRSMEVLVEPNKPFRVVMQSGKETITLSGKLQPSQAEKSNSNFALAVKYGSELEKVADDANNRTKPVRTTRRINTSLGMNVGEPVKTAALISTRSNQPGELLKSQVRYMLVLTKYNPNIKE